MTVGRFVHLLSAALLAAATPCALAWKHTKHPVQIVLPSPVEPERLGLPVDWDARVQLSPIGGFVADNPIQLTVVDDNREPTSPSPVQVPFVDPGPAADGAFSYSAFVIDGGGVMSASSGWGNTRGAMKFGRSGPRTLRPEDYRRIQALVVLLPDDLGIIPPRNHKVSVEVLTSTGSLSRTYDVSHLPPPLLEIFKLVGFQLPAPPPENGVAPIL
ncbi:MAG TPA: hypothetical protein VHX60_07885 [Acidobacteriaceae bacterium]|jgi:hypothetical protein|nr:hypothetical protein [Acidobacteriaceae bacterium]